MLMPVITPWCWCQNASNCSDMLIIYIGHTSKSDECFWLKVSFVSVGTGNDTMMAMQAVILWYWHHGAYNDSNVMLIVYICDIEKVSMQLSTESLLYLNKQWQLSLDANAVVPAMMVMSYWSCTWVTHQDQINCYQGHFIKLCIVNHKNMPIVAYISQSICLQLHGHSNNNSQ